MSISYKNRKKAIRDEKRRLGRDGLEHGQIPKKRFLEMQSEWRRKIDGPPIGTLEDLMRVRQEHKHG